MTNKKKYIIGNCYLIVLTLGQIDQFSIYVFISENMGRRKKLLKCVEEKFNNLKRCKKQQQKTNTKTPKNSSRVV